MARALPVLAAWACLSSAAGFPKPPRTIPPLNPGAPTRLSEKEPARRVLVAGAGLAGLSAALELAERGFSVTIRESEAYVGGRLHSRPVKVDVPYGEEPFMVEHGFHAWFHNYWTFKDLRLRLGIDGNFRPWGAVHFVFKDYKPEQLFSRGPYPLNLLGVIARSPNLKLTDAVQSLAAVSDLVLYNYDTVYDTHDNISFIEWGRQKQISKPFFDIIFAPTLSVTLNERQVISAAEMLTFQQLYFLSDAEADKREVATEDYHTAVLGPWTERLKALGVNLSLSDPVRALYLSDSNGTVDDTGSRYDAVIVAADLVGTKSILEATVADDRQDALLEVRRIVDRVPLAPPYKVVRVWFDRQLSQACQTDAGCPDLMETPDFGPVNLVAQYHLLEGQSAAWAKKTGGSIIEFHSYTWTYGDMSDREVWDRIAPAAYKIYPEIALNAWKVLAVHVNSYQNFPSCAVGTNRNRPDSDLALKHGLPGLVFAGDWLRPSFPAALMERAVSTGRQAANLVLLQHGVRQVPLKVTASQGPGVLQEVDLVVV